MEEYYSNFRGKQCDIPEAALAAEGLSHCLPRKLL